jgi:nicotinamide-nucleotide amidase
MWHTATATAAFAEAIRGATTYEQRTLRLYGLPESEIATTLREAEQGGVPLERIEVTTCVRGGELEIVSRFEPAAAEVYRDFEDVVRARHHDTLFSLDGSTVDEQVAALLTERGLTVAVAESCTGGLVLGRLTDRPGSSAFLRGGMVVYANDVKSDLADVPAALIERYGAVSEEVAVALADGARGRVGTDIGIGVTGIAGPDGGTPEKPVGLVWIALTSGAGAGIVRRADQRGSRADVRERTTTAVMHLLRRTLDETADPATA